MVDSKCIFSYFQQKWVVKNDLNLALQLFLVISDSLGSVMAFVCLFVMELDRLLEVWRLQARTLCQSPLLVSLTPRSALSSHQHTTLVCIYWSGTYTVYTHQRITIMQYLDILVR